MPAFTHFSVLKTNEATTYYTSRIHDEISPLVRPRNSRAVQRTHSESHPSIGGDPEILFALSMKLTSRLPHEITRNDVQRALNYEGDAITSPINALFARYKIDQYRWAHMEGETSDKSISVLMAEYRETHTAPWDVLREHLDQMREAIADAELFNFSFSNPENVRLTAADHSRYSFETVMTNRSTGYRYPLGSLSSGETILMSLCLAAFNQAMGRRQLKLILLDEIDSVLHPSMIKLLIGLMKQRFVANGTKVVMTTQAVTTVSIVDDREVFRVARSGTKVVVSTATRAAAVAELSEGIASIDTGLRIAAASSAEIVMLTEGNNVLHLRKWASLFFPGRLDVLDGIMHRSGASQLKTYGELLAKLRTTSHFLIVWDCDAGRFATKLSGEIAGSDHVTAFAFRKRDNRITSKGIENLYDERYLETFAATTRMPGGGPSHRSIPQTEKTKFAEHVNAEGTAPYFEHFGELREIVEQILARRRQGNSHG